MPRLVFTLLLALMLLIASSGGVLAAESKPLPRLIEPQIAAHPGKTGAYIGGAPGNGEPVREIRQPRTAYRLGRRRFLCDLPGKNEAHYRFDGGGRITAALVDELKKARSVTIQTPYLVMPEGGLELFRDLIKRGVEGRIVTNSLASTDNLQAFSGYQKQRKRILKSGIKVFEFRTVPAIVRELVERYPKLEKEAPIFAIHAKSMVIDGKTLFVGTFNLDPFG